MFSGIIDHMGRVVDLQHASHSLRLRISSQFADLVLGESIAVDGVCLTVTEFTDSHFNVDISQETLALTQLVKLSIGQSVNLERALRLNDRLGGHMVTGHVDQVAEVKSILAIDDAREVEITGIHESFIPYLIPKGSIAVNGVSLTLNQLNDNGFKLMLIPHSLHITNLSELEVGSKVNLEFDNFTKTVFKQLKFLVRDFYVQA